MNRFDLDAPETVLRLRERPGGKVTVGAMGPPQARAVIRAAYTMGTDEGPVFSDRRLGGEVGGGHGTGHAKRPFLLESIGAEQMRPMQGIKAVSAPKGILNPRKSSLASLILLALAIRCSPGWLPGGCKYIVTGGGGSW